MKKSLTLALVLLFPCAAKADPAQGPASFSSGQAIETKMDLGIFGLLGGGMTYSVNGQKITRDEDFKQLIYPLRDKEASKLIRESHEEHFAAALCYVGGLAVGTDVALFIKPNPLFYVDFLDRIATGFIALQIFAGAGALFDGNAESRRYNAVQRYNNLIKARDEAFLDLSPEVSFCDNQLNLELARAF